MLNRAYSSAKQILHNLYRYFMHKSFHVFSLINFLIDLLQNGTQDAVEMKEMVRYKLRFKKFCRQEIFTGFNTDHLLPQQTKARRLKFRI